MKKSEVFKKCVLCIDGGQSGLTPNKKYLVVGYGDDFGERQDYFVRIINDYNREESYFKRRFK